MDALPPLQVLGKRNLDMIRLARSVGAAAKFTGSGGCVIVLCPEGQDQAQRLKDLAVQEGFSVVEAQIAPEVEL